MTTPSQPPPSQSSPAAALPSFACPSCGSQMNYEPGTTEMKCPSCGKEVQIAAAHTIVEHSYDAWASVPEKPVAMIAEQALKCQGCGAITETDAYSDLCQFCNGVLVLMQDPPGLIAPEAVVPFGIDKKGAQSAFATWVKSRRFAPNALKKVGSAEALKGTYVPHWTFDAQTQTDYVGQRGEHYYTTESFPVSDGQGHTHMETREVQHTRWYPASGHVARDFDDVLVVASRVLPSDRLVKMGPWRLDEAAAFEPQFLAGYAALRYDVDPGDGLTAAHSEMEGVIRGDCVNDIGGDEQRVDRMNIAYAATMFKLVLLPLWIASYLYAGKTFQVLVNANTGEVIGERPYSKVKIFFAVLAAVVLIAAIVTIVILARHNGSSG